MSATSRFRKLLLGATACLLVAWIGGTLGATGFKALSWLVFGIWPRTDFQDLLPETALRAVLALPADDLGGQALRAMLRLDLLTLVLALPLLALLPCLALLRGGRRPAPPPARRRPPFANRAETEPGTGPSKRDASSTKNGSPPPLPR